MPLFRPMVTAMGRWSDAQWEDLRQTTDDFALASRKPARHPIDSASAAVTTARLTMMAMAAEVSPAAPSLSNGFSLPPPARRRPPTKFGGAPEAGRPPAGDRRHPARLAAAADHPQPCQELRQMRERRRPQAGGPHRELCGWADAADTVVQKQQSDFFLSSAKLGSAALDTDTESD
jgi:hypothetical protein